MKSWVAPSILIVEDELILAKDLQRCLRDFGYDAFAVATCAEDAVARADEQRPDLVLMDIRLKGRTDGINAAAMLQSRYSVIVIYLTAHSDTAILERAKATNPYGYLVKPVNLVELRTTIEASLHRHALDCTRERLYASERRLMTITEHVPFSIAYFDTSSRLQFANKLFRQLAEPPNRYDAAADIFDHCVFYKQFFGARERALAGENVILMVRFQLNGGLRDYEFKMVPDRDAGGVIGGVYCLGFDVTESLQSQTRVRDLAIRLESVREEERRALAVKLHDGIAQDLFAVKLMLDEVGKKTPRRDKFSQAGKEATAAIVQCMDEIRRIANDLRPVALRYFHAATVIRDHARFFGESAHIAIRVTEEDPFPTLDESVNLLLFRAAQEALTNVARHAQANTVDIVLRADCARISMEICDDGIGIPDGALCKPRSLGLLAIRERFEAMGGGLQVERASQSGSRLIVHLPTSVLKTASVAAANAAGRLTAAATTGALDTVNRLPFVSRRA